MDLRVTKYQIDEGVATGWLHRPGRENSWTNRLNAEYGWVMDTLDNGSSSA